MIQRIVGTVVTLDTLWLILTVLIGVGCLAYVVVAWDIYFVGRGQYLMAAAVSAGALLLSFAAALRIPIALVLFFGGAVAIGTAFFVGAMNIVLP